MAEANARTRWQHTSNLLAMMANVNATKKSKKFKPSDFNPFENKNSDAVLITKDNIGLLKSKFIGGAKAP
ncbi:MAG: hypothetical protein JXD22_11730 [Sedimentisphaerales bacterium]|nr:hypothetical protein [Sedimentisphaerales bacterium]